MALYDYFIYLFPEKISEGEAKTTRQSVTLSGHGLCFPFLGRNTGLQALRIAVQTKENAFWNRHLSRGLFP